MDANQNPEPESLTQTQQPYTRADMVALRSAYNAQTAELFDDYATIGQMPDGRMVVWARTRTPERLRTLIAALTDELKKHEGE